MREALRVPPMLLRCAAIALAALLAPAIETGAALAQAYPTKPVRLIVPFPAGGTADVVGRIVAQKLTAALGQQVIVDNRGGAGGTIGLELAAKSANDGYTLVLGTIGTLIVAPNFYPKLGYDPFASFAPISLLISAPYLIVVHPSVGATTLKEFIDLARSKPGQFNFGSNGIGNLLHISGELFNRMAGVKLVHVPYQGEAPAVVDLLANRVQVMFNQPGAFQQYVQTQRLRALAVANATRLPQFPALPTTAEAGLPGFEVTAWFGLLLPAGTGADIRARLGREVAAALAAKDVRDAFTNLGVEPAPSSAARFAAFMRDENTKWAPVIKSSGAKAD